MSFELMRLAWNLDLPRGSDKAVAVNLAWHADDGGLAWPSLATIAREINRDVQAVKASLARLDEQYISRRIIPGRPTEYFVHLGLPRVKMTPGENDPGSKPSPTPGENHTGTPGENDPPPRVKITPRTDKELKLELTGEREQSTRASIALPDWMPIEAWNGFLEMRKAKKVPATPHALTLIIAKLGRFKADGHEPELVLNESTARGWTTVYPLKSKDLPNGRDRNTERRSDFNVISLPNGGTSQNPLAAAIDRAGAARLGR